MFKLGRLGSLNALQDHILPFVQPLLLLSLLNSRDFLDYSNFYWVNFDIDHWSQFHRFCCQVKTDWETQAMKTSNAINSIQKNSNKVSSESSLSNRVCHAHQHRQKQKCPKSVHHGGLVIMKSINMTKRSEGHISRIVVCGCVTTNVAKLSHTAFL